MAERVSNWRQWIAHRKAAFLGALTLCLAMSAHADTTTLTVADAVKGTSSTPVTMQFPVTRSGDTSYDTVLTYHTVNGTAVAPLDYIGSVSSIAISAGSTSANVPVTVSAYPFGGPDRTFQLLLDAATGIGPAPTFAAQQTFGTGLGPYSVTVADVNGDGKPDLIAVNEGSHTVSVLLDTTAPGATTPSFSPQQTFATGAGCASVTTTDVNGDGKLDLIVANFFDNTVSVLLNTTATGGATPSFATQQTFATGAGPILVTVADVNGDGKTDLIATNFGPGGSGNTVSVLLNTTIPGATAPSFATQQTFATGSGPVFVSAEDVNGDGDVDLIVANESNNTVSVLLNSTAPGATTPSFATQQTFATGLFPQSIFVTDINGDGKPDLIVANYNDNSASVLLNTTTPGAITPSFAPQQTFGTGVGPVSVTAVDINGDGKPDLVVANLNDNTVSMLLNATVPGATTANFATQQPCATGMNPLFVTDADVNGDGKLDLIVANTGDNTVSVLLNTTPPPTATPNFAAQQTFGTASFPHSVTAADVNGDGKLDLVVAAYSGTVSVLLNVTAAGASTPSFAIQQPFTVGSHPSYATAADVNGDGEPDLIAVNQSDNTASVLLNSTVPGSATLSFSAQQTFTVGAGPSTVAAIDVNGDGRPDLIVANETGNTVSVLINTTPPGATTPSFATQSFAAGLDPYSATAADVNGDGKPDLIAANAGDNAVSVRLNTTAPGATTPSFATQQSFATGVNPNWVAVADVNGDGKLDLIVANDSTVSVLLNTTAPGATTPSFAAQQAFAAGSGLDSVSTADVNGDGKPDLIAANINDHTLSVLLNTTIPGAGTPTFAAQQIFAIGLGPYSATAADVNGDGRPDLLVANYGNNTVSVLLNTQYQALFAGSPATGTIVHDYIFANGFN